jgi:hypothetical protein
MLPAFTVWERLQISDESAGDCQTDPDARSEVLLRQIWTDNPATVD